MYFDDLEFIEQPLGIILAAANQSIDWVSEHGNGNQTGEPYMLMSEPDNPANTIHTLRSMSGYSRNRSDFEVKPSTRYRLTYRINLSEQGSGMTQEWIQFLDHNQQPGDIQNVVTVIDNDVRGWQTKTLEFSTPAQGESIGNGRQFSGNAVRIGFELTGQTAAVAEVWLDDIQLREVTEKRHRVISAQDYYPYGLTIPGRSFNIGSLGESKFKYQSKERDSETGYDYFAARLALAPNNVRGPGHWALFAGGSVGGYPKA